MKTNRIKCHGRSDSLFERKGYILATILFLVAPCFARNADMDVQIPIQSYAVIDLSRTATDGCDVTDVALDDDENVAFGFYTPIQANEWNYQSYTLANGTPTPETTIPMGWQGDFNAEHWIYANPILLPNGKVGISKTNYDVPGGAPNGGDQLEHAYFADKNGYVWLPPLPSPLTWDYWDSGYVGLLCAVSEQSYAFMGTFPYTLGPNDTRHTYCSFIFHDNSYVAFFCNSFLSIPGVLTHTEAVIPSTINAKGSGWGYDAEDTSICYFWDDKTETLSTPFANTDTPVDLNDQTEVVVKKANQGEGYLWKPDGSKTQFIDVLPKIAKGQYNHFQPLSIGNQLAPAPASPADTTIHVICDAQYHSPRSSSATDKKVLFTRDNNGIWTVARIQLPTGITITNWNTINKYGVVAAIGTSNSWTPADEKKAFLLSPLELKDIKSPNDPNDDVVVETKEDSSDTSNLKTIAWIDPELAIGSPQMPQLEARLRGADSMTGLNVQWKLEVKYDRGNGSRTSRNQTEDTITIPANGFATYPASEAWKIYQESDWTKQIDNNGFFGGEATLTIKIGNQAEQKFYFRIGGKNPSNATARQFIDDQANSNEWFSYAIAKHETAEYQYNGSLYNQFRSNPDKGKVGLPTWNNDGGSTPGGYGIFQITGSPTDSEANIPRRQIWNWQDDVRAYFAILRNPIKSGLAIRYFNRISSQYPAQYQEDPPPNVPVGTDSFTSATAIWITSYNGWPGGLSNGYIFTSDNPPGLGSTKRWYWNPPNNPDEPYINKVERQLHQ